ncbi:outer membrane beta-barrel protein [Terricaulis silvestris]|uniref:TonB-dependent receptor n=1 Tax=Terricaulis silvestris TaxID=2686094 RepID=A0A6I6MHU9_9CAUL|nr:outer membrane beta-barrel protein [Terricaulis silvestris]QGZ94520.1 TonB-dependent receptor [Terricaulis silvestris]
MLGRMMVSALALMSGVAYAQTAPTETPVPAPTSAPASATNDRVVYEVAFYARFNPQNAMDMVNNTPGFTLNSGDERRGFSGAVGNVLVDGLRPTAKGQSIDSILARIPANQIVRLEVLRGAEVAGDASGQATLINIVRAPTAGSGVYEVGFEYSNQNQDRLMPRADIGYNGRNGQLEWGVGLRLITQNRDLIGERDFYDGAGVLQRHADMTNPRNLWDPYYNANIAFPLFGGRFSATGMINPDWFNAQRQTFDFTTPTGDPDGSLTQRWKEEGTLSEVGLNYDRDFGPWSLALVGLRTQHPFEYNETAVEYDALGVVTETAVVNSERETIETILRGTLSRSFGPQHRIEFGGEGAVNTLDSEFQFILDTGGGPSVIPIPNSNVTVEEERADLFAVHTWRPNDRWSLESRVAWETSTLTFTGDADQTTELSFWKPSFQLTRTFGGNNQLRLRYYRDVGQLDFDDFVSSTSLADDLIDGGNPDLQPQTDWRAEVGGDLRFPGGAALGFALVHHQISDVNDLVVLINTQGTPDPGDDEPFDAPGNIGDAEAWSLDLNFSSRIPFIPNSRLTVEAEFWDTEVTDPVTGNPRIISWQPESEVDIAFRQDFPEQRWSWGIEAYKQGEVQGYRLTDVDTQEEGPWVDLWWETTALPNNMKLRLWAANIGNGEVLRDRRIFGPDRNGPLVAQQLTNREFATSPWFILELSGSF